MNRTTLDARDQTILTHRVALYTVHTTPQVGHYVDFADGVTRRISYVWDGGREPGVQTSDGGSFYLGEGYCSFSGGLYPAVPMTTLTRSEATREGWAWFFHHDYHTAHNGVHARIPCVVWRTTETSRQRGV